MSCAFSLTKKTIPLHGVTYVQLFGHSKRTPVLNRFSELGALPQTPKFLRHFEYRESQKKKSDVSLAFPFIHLKYSSSSCASTELDSASLRFGNIALRKEIVKWITSR